MRVEFFLSTTVGNEVSKEVAVLFDLIREALNVTYLCGYSASVTVALILSRVW